MTAEEVLLWAYERFGDRMCLTCSWQRQSSVLVHMVFGELGLDVPVIELDTQLFFRETYETRDRLVERYGLKLERPPVISVAEQHAREGHNLWERDPDRCCHIRKVEPLERALAPYDAWVTGIRREQALRRENAQRVEWLHSVHPAGGRRRRRTRRSRDRRGQDRMRQSHELRRRMDNGFTLWFSGLSGAGKTTIA